LDRDGIAGPDQLGYKPYAAALFQLLSNHKTELPLSLAVSAPWGSGKTSIMRWINYELDCHRRNIHHQCTVIPGVETWGGLPFRERIKAEVDMALQGVRDLHRKTWVNALNRARWARWPLPVQRLVRRGPANWSRPLDAAARAGLTRHCRTVWIDAWKYESGAALWAAFTKEIYRQAQKQTGGWSARLKFRLALANGVDPTESGYSWGWVFWKVALSYLKERWTVLTAAGTGVGLGIATWQVLDPSEAVLIGGGGLAGLAGLVKGLFTQPFSFNLDKASAAAANRPEPVDSVGAPDDIARMIRLLAHRKDEAMVVFVDDLDRCSPDKVKEAVEAINLLFNGTERAQTVFILGMDVDLVSASMQVAYRPMVAELRRVENSSASDFGYRFLSKIVQLSLNIPTPAPSAMENYLGGLIGTEVPRNGDAPTPIPAAAPAAPRTPESDAERTGRIKQDAKKVISGLRSNEARSNAGDQAVVEDRSPEERDEFVEELRKVIQQENLRGLTRDSPEVQKAIQDGSRTLPPRPRGYNVSSTPSGCNCWSPTSP